ncbi:MAG: hypothetical protein WC319_00535 [Candidatus Paceibacterota bacterium]|jgi:hypothetical protein
MDENFSTQNNTGRSSDHFMINDAGSNPFMREDADRKNPLIRDDSKGPGMTRKFERPAIKEKIVAEKPSFFKGRRDVTKREILWKIAQPDAYKNMWGGKSRTYKDKMASLAEKHFTKGQYEHYTAAELKKITRAIEKEVNKEEGSWKLARNDMLGRIKDIIN